MNKDFVFSLKTAHGAPYLSAWLEINTGQFMLGLSAGWSYGQLTLFCVELGFVTLTVWIDLP